MKREEVKAKTLVDWYYTSTKEKERIHVGLCYIIVYNMICGMCVHTGVDCVYVLRMSACLSSLLDIKV